MIKGSLDNQTGRLDCVIGSRVCFVGLCNAIHVDSETGAVTLTGLNDCFRKKFGFDFERPLIDFGKVGTPANDCFRTVFGFDSEFKFVSTIRHEFSREASTI